MLPYNIVHFYRTWYSSLSGRIPFTCRYVAPVVPVNISGTTDLHRGPPNLDVVPCCFVVPTRKEAHDRPWKKSINRNEPSLIKKIVERLILINILFFVKHKFSYGPSETRHSTGAGDEHERSNNLLLHVAPKSIRDYKCAPKFLAGATLLLRATSEHQSDKWMERGLRPM